MGPIRMLFSATCLLGAAHLAGPARASEFTTFAADENVCRGVGPAAIKGAACPSAAQRYDMAYQRCMVWHGRMRQLRDAGEGDGYPVGNPHSFEYPDAFYSIPYATPGYGYDGFSY